MSYIVIANYKYKLPGAGMRDADEIKLPKVLLFVVYDHMVGQNPQTA